MMKNNFKILLFAFSIFAHNTINAQLFSTTSFNANKLVVPEKVLTDVKSLALVGFDIKGVSEPSRFVRETETSSRRGLLTGSSSTKTYTREIKDPYSVDHSSLIMNSIEGGLLAEKRGLSGTCPIDVKTNIYHLVERSKLDAIAAEQKQSLTGLFDESKVASLGKLAGADAIMSATGDYGFHDKINKREYEKDGKKYVSYTTTREVTTHLNIKIISVETGSVLYSKSITEKEKKDVKGQKKGPDFGHKVNNLAKDAFKRSVYRLLNEISPYYTRQRVVTKKIKMKEFKDRTKDAQDYLKDGFYDRAFPIYQAIYDADAYNDRAIYNLGTLYEVTGQYTKAKELYEEAVDANTDDKHYQEALNRSIDGIKTVELLNKLGIKFEEYKFKEITETTLSERCKTKGNYKDRINVYQSPDKKSPVIDKIPGGKEFIIKKEVDGYYLLTGLKKAGEGYISTKDAKK